VDQYILKGMLIYLDTILVIKRIIPLSLMLLIILVACGYNCEYTFSDNEESYIYYKNEIAGSYIQTMNQAYCSSLGMFVNACYGTRCTMEDCEYKFKSNGFKVYCVDIKIEPSAAMEESGYTYEKYKIYVAIEENKKAIAFQLDNEDYSNEFELSVSNELKKVHFVGY